MRNLLLFFCLLCAVFADAKVKLLPIFSDNMVLQQHTNAPIWGEAKPGRKVTVNTSWNGAAYTTKADAKGRWRVSVATPSAGGPYEMTLSDGTPTTLHGIMIGEVWLCSGQSNMAMPMEGWNVKTNADEIAASAATTGVRLLRIDNATSLTPTTDMPAQSSTWQECSPATVAKFSAAAYFFGKRLAALRGVPVGVIMSCWGGTTIESWIGGDALSTVPGMKAIVDSYVNDTLTAEQHEKKFQIELKDWFLTTGKAEGSISPDGSTAVWAAPYYDDSSWQLLSQPLKIDNVGYTEFDGVVWYRKTINVPEAWAGKPLRLQLSTIDDIDVTYFNGHEVGHTESCPVRRDYTIPAKLVKGGRAVIAVRVLDTGSAGGLRGDSTSMSISCGDDVRSLGGEWRIKLASDLNTTAPVPANPIDNPFVPTALYNAMIRPLAPYAIKGMLWYQGESNAPHASRYRELLALLIANWRNDWQQPFPVIIQQLANYLPRKAEPGESEWAELREAQLQSLSIDGTALSVAIDAGDAADIHPTDKQTVGDRMALAAQQLAYGEDVEGMGPLYHSYKIEGNKIRITFTHTTGGLKAMDKNSQECDTLKGFAIAGADRKFHWAEARIVGHEVVVQSAEVAVPVAVRYAWADNPDCNLRNGAGLPASPFRTDNWPGLTTCRQ